MRRLTLPLLLCCVALLAACAGFGGDEATPVSELLESARNALRQANSLSFAIEPIGAPPPLNLQISDLPLDFQLVFADVQVIQPSSLYVDARLEAGGILTLDIAIFMQENRQFYRLPALGWQESELAPGFLPGQLLSSGGTLDQALLSLSDPQTLGIEYLADGQRAHHLIASAAGATLSPLLFDLATLTPQVQVDLWLEREPGRPVRLELREPNAEQGWRFTFYDYDRAPRFTEEDLPIPFSYDPSAFATSAPPPTRVSSVTTVLITIVILLGSSTAAIALALRHRSATATAPETQYPPAARAWRVLAIILIPLFIGSLDLTVVSAFLPELFVDLNLPLQSASDDALWVLSGYLLAYLVSLTFVGRASDLLGRRPVYVVSLLLFFLGSLWVARADGLPYQGLATLFARLELRLSSGEIGLQSILIGRVIQAFGAGALVPVSLALVSDLFPPERRARPFGLIAAVDTLGWVLGHLYGGALIAAFASPAGRTIQDFAHRAGATWFALNWQTLFWINLPLTVWALWVVLRSTRGLPERRSAGRFDFLGALLLTSALICLIIGLGANIDPNQDLSRSSLPPYALPLLVLCAVCLLAYAAWSRRIQEPIFAWELLRRPPLAAASWVNLCVGFVIMIGLISVPILVNVTLDTVANLPEGALRVGLLLSALTIPMALAAWLGGGQTERVGPQRVAPAGLLLAALGFALIWQTWDASLPDGWIALQLGIVGIGLGLTLAPISSASLNAARRDERGAIGALVILLRLLGMTLSATALANYALSRINARAIAELGAALDPIAYAESYANIAIAVIAELGGIGLLVCALALLPAGRLGRTQ
ncbi:MAG: MFS transporter [Anaerolineaceae bacterium]|nr:MFS transporter [Anaerolineaceae bacterium]